MLAAAGLFAAGPASAQGWKPERNVELIIPTSPGGSNDIAGRTIQKLWTELKLLPVTSSVVNRSGGEHVVAYTYVSQRTGDAHAIGMMSTPLVMNPAGGRTQLTHNDLTPIAYLITEPMIAMVRADSPLKTGKDLLDALRKNPAALSIALTSNGHRVSIGVPLQKAGVNIRDVRMPAFKGGGETAMAVMGGHADVQITSVSTAVPHITSGQMRGIALSSGRRLGGVMASVPTWQELGFQSSGSWKGVMGPKGLTPAQVAYWDGTFAKVFALKAWKEDVATNHWDNAALTSRGAARYMDKQYEFLKQTLADLEMAR